MSDGLDDMHAAGIPPYLRPGNYGPGPLGRAGQPGYLDERAQARGQEIHDEIHRLGREALEDDGTWWDVLAVGLLFASLIFIGWCARKMKETR